MPSARDREPDRHAALRRHRIVCWVALESNALPRATAAPNGAGDAEEVSHQSPPPPQPLPPLQLEPEEQLDPEEHDDADEQLPWSPPPWSPSSDKTTGNIAEQPAPLSWEPRPFAARPRAADPGTNARARPPATRRRRQRRSGASVHHQRMTPMPNSARPRATHCAAFTVRSEESKGRLCSPAEPGRRLTLAVRPAPPLAEPGRCAATWDWPAPLPARDVDVFACPADLGPRLHRSPLRVNGARQRGAPANRGAGPSRRWISPAETLLRAAIKLR